jgi:lipopolysaccharide biosynthesis protein
LVIKHFGTKKGNLLQLPKKQTKQLKLAIHLHLFHEEYIEKVIKYFEKNKELSLFISVPSDDFKKNLQEKLNQVAKLEIRTVENKGRNFAPLFVEFGEQLGKYDLVLHLHSKAAQNSYKRKKWAESLWDYLLLKEDFLNDALTYFEEMDNIGLYYPRDFRWFPPTNGWDGTDIKSKLFFPELAPSIEVTKEISFPVGGMFLSRGSNISYISSVVNSWDYFPAETSNQYEISKGLTLEHSLERLISQVNSFHGFDSLIYDCNQKTFFIEPKGY